MGPVGRWAGACVRAGAFWGVQDWSAGLVRLVAGGVRLRCAGRSAAAQMSRGRLRMCPRAVVKVFAHGQLSGRRSLWRPLLLTMRPGTVRSRLRMVAATVSWRVGWAASEAGGPAGEVVREHAAGEPGAVGEESS